MALVNRISRLFTADLHAVLDRLEEPQTLLKQALREMEEELARSEQRIKQLEAEARQLETRGGQLEAAIAEVDQKLDLCFASGKDELARTQVRRKLEAERLAKIIGQRRRAIAAQMDRERAALEENRARLDGLRQQAEAVAAEQPPGAAEEPDFTRVAFPIGDEELEVAWLAEKQRRARS